MLSCCRFYPLSPTAEGEGVCQKDRKFDRSSYFRHVTYHTSGYELVSARSPRQVFERQVIIDSKTREILAWWIIDEASGCPSIAYVDTASPLYLRVVQLIQTFVITHLMAQSSKVQLFQDPIVISEDPFRFKLTDHHEIVEESGGLIVVTKVVQPFKTNVIMPENLDIDTSSLFGVVKVLERYEKVMEFLTQLAQ